MPKPISIRVTSMDAELEFSIMPSTTGRQLFDQVAKTLGVREVWHFGLQILDSERHKIWLKYSRRVMSQITKHQGKTIKTQADEKPQLMFLVKFYPEDVSKELIQDITVKLFYLQMKESIVEGELFCTPEVSVLLASYAAQVKYGDYDNDKDYSHFMKAEQWLPGRIVAEYQVTEDQWLERILEWYAEHRGMLKEDAMMEYLRIVQDLEMYGVNYFEVTNKNNTPLILGVDALGLSVYDKDNKLVPRLGFPWNEVRHLHSHNKKFVIKPVDKKTHDFVFFSPNKTMNKQILLLSAGNHQLFKRRRESEPMEVLQMRRNARAEKEAKLAERKAFYMERMQRMEAERNKVELEDKLHRYQSQYHLAIQELEKSKSNLHLSHLSEDQLDRTNRNSTMSEILSAKIDGDFSDESRTLREKIEAMKEEIEDRRKVLKLILENDTSSQNQGGNIKHLLSVYSSLIPSDEAHRSDESQISRRDSESSEFKLLHERIEALSLELAEVRQRTQDCRREMTEARKQQNTVDILNRHDLFKYFSQDKEERDI